MDDDWFEDSERLYPEGMDGPTVKAPSVDIPTASGDVFQRSEIARLFVLHVFVWNAVILLLSLGVMLIYFRSDWETGRQLLAAGVVLTVYGVYRWPRGGDDTDDIDDTGDTDDTDDTGDTDDTDDADDPESVAAGRTTDSTAADGEVVDVTEGTDGTDESDENDVTDTTVEP
jgi:hypothetical protein